MTKKHYIAFATALGKARAKAAHYTYNKEATIDILMDAIITVLRRDNSRFDSGRFLDYIDRVIVDTWNKGE